MSAAGPIAVRQPLAVLVKNLQMQIEGAMCSDKEGQLHLETLGKNWKSVLRVHWVCVARSLLGE